MINTDAWRFGDDPDNAGCEVCGSMKLDEAGLCLSCDEDDPKNSMQADNCEKCEVLLEDWDKTLVCLECFHAEHGPDNDKDLDPESIGGYTYDIQAIKDTQEGT